MDIKTIENPLFLKRYSSRQLKELAADIRLFLIDNVSKTGGHLSSNLGVVELTIALHLAFNGLEDKLIFDVGHQSYVHKILTGRASRFSSLRQYNGLSGFQKREESPYDCWEAGHSSTSLSAALGFALSRDLKGQSHHVVPIIGDGALTSGMAFEALNHIGAAKRNMIIVFNDNDMSISENVGAITQGFSRLRSSKSYNTFKHDIKDVLKSNVIGSGMLKGMQKVRDTIKSAVVDSSIFGEMGLDYLGPIDGHDIKLMTKAFDIAKKHTGPIVIHVCTIKGKGYLYSEDDREGKWHGVSQFDPDTGASTINLPPNQYAWSSVISETLIDLAKKDSRICAITPAMITGSKLEKFFALFPHRSFDCGIAEEHAATLAAGLAISGSKPFLSLYSSFLQRAYDQINHDICRMNLPVIIGIDRANLVGEDGDTHHGVFDIGILRPLPNLVIAAPKDGDEARQLLLSALNHSGPFAIRYPRGTTHITPQHQGDSLEIGTWEIKQHDLAKCILISYGPDLLRFESRIETNQLPVTMVNARFIKPMDSLMLERIFASNLPVVIYEPDMKAGGLSSAISEWAIDHQVTSRIIRIGIDDVFVTHGSVAQLRRQEKIDTNSLFDVIKEVISS